MLQPPAQLLAVGRLEVAGYGGEVVEDSVTGISGRAPTQAPEFSLTLGSGRRVTARRVVVATGLRDELPDLPGLRERWARDVLHCPYCHGYEVRDRPFGVVGLAPGSAHYAQIVRQWSDDLVYFTPKDALTGEERAGLTARGIEIVEGELRRVVVEDDRLRGVELADGRVVRREVLFVPPRFVPRHDLLLELGCALDEAGWVVADPTGLTTVPGVWVAGNVANPRAQVITAAGEGSAAAGALNADLIDEEVRAAVRARAETDAD